MTKTRKFFAAHKKIHGFDMTNLIKEDKSTAKKSNAKNRQSKTRIPLSKRCRSHKPSESIRVTKKKRKKTEFDSQKISAGFVYQKNLNTIAEEFFSNTERHRITRSAMGGVMSFRNGIQIPEFTSRIDNFRVHKIDN